MRQSQIVRKFGIFITLAYNEPHSDYMAHRNIIKTLPWILSFTWYLSSQGWSAVDETQLRQTNTQTLRNLHINLFKCSNCYRMVTNYLCY